MERYLKNFDLPEISCFAAKEIKGYILNKEKKLDATNELIFRINKFTSNINIYPTEVIIFLDTLKEQSDREIKQVDDLVFKISLANQELSSIKTLPKKRLEHLRTFCLNLSYKAIAYDNNNPSYLVA